MSLVAEYANETLTDIAPGMLTLTEASSPLDTPADPVMATFLTVTCPEVVALFGAATGALAANIYNYVARNGG
ncbi:linaridin-like RiPP [Streptomyces sp. NPDC044780]|uniref:linaridin-like RiPP n=1 Tax=unclassified Streptomyces TaxID=2593676 RepID=UPI0033E72A2B